MRTKETTPQTNAFQSKLEECAMITLRDCLDLKGQERLTVVADESSATMLPHILFDTARKLGGKATMLRVIRPNVIIDDSPVLQYLEQSEIVIAITGELFPILVREKILDHNGRVVLMHTVTDELALRTIPVDYGLILNRLDTMSKTLAKSTELTLTSKNGTDLRFSCQDRPLFKFDGVCRNAGEYDSLPAGSIYSSPIEETANGVVVIDTAGYLSGPIGTPFKLRISGGVVVDVSGGDEALRVKRLIDEGGENSQNLAEVGVGVHPTAKTGSSPIESERAEGSVTIGLGRNTQLGGKVHSRVHLDIGVLSNVTLEADHETVIEAGTMAV